MIEKIKKLIARQSYLKYFYNSTVHSNYIFLESQHGNNINGNIFYILKELVSNSEYRDYRIYLAVQKTKKTEICQLLNQYHLDCNLVVMDTKEYYQKLSESKYLFNDTSFLTFFIKKDEQIYINTWHGTPLKTLGKDVKNDRYRIGNIQKNLLESDYLLAPSTFFKECLMNSYMLNELYQGTFLMGGYPRNCIFFDNEKGQNIKIDLDNRNKKVFAFMPTWRGTVSTVSDEARKYQEMLFILDGKLNDSQRLYVNFHPFMSSHIVYKEYQHIFPFPAQYETYDFLNSVDCLITDYSSVFFDFVNTGKKVILYVEDEELYQKERGLYLNLSQLPFPKTRNIDELVSEMNEEINYKISDFVKKYCPFENAFAAKNICRHVILHEKCISEEKIGKNGKKNILIFGGRMIKNGITTSLLNLLEYIDSKKYNIYISFTARNEEEGLNTVDLLPKNVLYFPHYGKMNLSIIDFIYLGLYYFRCVPYQGSKGRMERISKNELLRLYGHTHFDSVIHFRGYVFTTIWLYAQMRCQKSIFVHNDMIQEMKKKRNQHPWTLRYAYQHYDYVAPVSEDIIDSVLNISENQANICVCHNIINEKRILQDGSRPIQIESQTVMTCSKDELMLKLSSNKFTFVNVGRFSVEKGHFRLIDAFDRFYTEHSDSQLIIIGGYGELYDKTVKYAQSKSSRDNIVLIKDVRNPLPIIRRCNGFILSSLYEGFGLVLAEANILGIPVVSTDIPGPRGFMEKYHGRLVEDSAEGIYQGLQELYNHLIQVMKVDYSQYNKEAIEQFYHLVE